MVTRSLVLLALLAGGACVSGGAALPPHVQTVPLRSPSGPVEMPLIGLGTAGLGGWGNSNASVAAIKLWIQARSTL